MLLDDLDLQPIGLFNVPPRPPEAKEMIHKVHLLGPVFRLCIFSGIMFHLCVWLAQRLER